jgi:hypothetical protein
LVQPKTARKTCPGIDPLITVTQRMKMIIMKVVVVTRIGGVRVVVVGTVVIVVIKVEIFVKMFVRGVWTVVIVVTVAEIIVMMFVRGAEIVLRTGTFVVLMVVMTMVGVKELIAMVRDVMVVTTTMMMIVIVKVEMRKSVLIVEVEMRKSVVVMAYQTTEERLLVQRNFEVVVIRAKDARSVKTIPLHIVSRKEVDITVTSNKK